MYLKNRLIALIGLIFILAPAAFAQYSPSNTDYTDKPQLSIHEGNLYCFQSLQCLVQEKPFRNSNLETINLNNSTKKYVIEGKSKNEELYAEYNGTTGNLIKSTVIQSDIILPKPIMEKLVSDQYKTWQMVGNKRIIKNFTKDTIRYEVILMKDEELQVVYFNRHGVAENPLS